LSVIATLLSWTGITVHAAVIPTITDQNGYCRTMNTADAIIRNYSDDFRTYSLMAVALVKNGLSIEFRQVLSKAFNLIQDLPRAEEPRTLDSFLEVFLYLIQKGLTEIVSMLREYINKMSINIIARDRP
jgi:hypothetical protein